MPVPLPLSPRAAGHGPEPVRAPKHPIRSVVVVGAGLAGAQTVAALRAQGFDGLVSLVGAEPLAPYDRPPLSKHLLDHPAPAWLVDELGVDVHALADDVRLGAEATGLAVEGSGVRVATTAGEVRADALVVASGSHAVRPPGWEGALTLHTAADAEVLRARCRPGARLVVVGAGWIGAEVAGVAAAAGLEVTVVEAADTPLAEALGLRVGALTAPWYAATGIHLIVGVRAAQVRADGVRLADGRWFPADVVLAAVGARPATGWLGAALPRDPDGSLRVDPGYGVVGAPGHVRAVGDVARRWSPRHGWAPGGHWDGALRGPEIAVRALLEGMSDARAIGEQSLDPGAPPGSYPASADRADLGPVSDPAPYVFSTQLGHELALYGERRPGDDLVLRGDPAGPGGWTALWFTPRAAHAQSAPGPSTSANPASDGGRNLIGELRHGRQLTAESADPRELTAELTDLRELTAALTVDRPRDAGAARRLFADARLPLLDPSAAADPARKLRDASRP